MIESINDFLNIAVTFAFCVVGFYYLYKVSARHHEVKLKKREDMYYRYYDSVSDDARDDDKNGLYYGE